MSAGVSADDLATLQLQHDLVAIGVGKTASGFAGMFDELPELSHHETRTAGRAAERLRQAGLEVHENIGGAGVVGILRNGDGPTVMLRADMDALPMAEDTGLPYASTATARDADGNEVPVAHSCGHDLHVTWLIATAQVLEPTFEVGARAMLAAASAWLCKPA